MKERLKGLLQLMQQSKNFTKLYKKAVILLKSHLKTPILHAFSHKKTLKYILKKWVTTPWLVLLPNVLLLLKKQANKIYNLQLKLSFYTGAFLFSYEKNIIKN